MRAGQGGDDEPAEGPPLGAADVIAAEWTRWSEMMQHAGSVDVELKLGRFKEPQDVVGDGCVLK